MESFREFGSTLNALSAIAHSVTRYAAIDMSTFEALKLAYLRSTGKEEPGVLPLLVFGSLSGGVGATSVYPMNLVRTRLQASGSPGHPQRYSGILDVARKTYHAEGWRGFYRGLVPTLAKVIRYCWLLAVHQLSLYSCRLFLPSLSLTLFTSTARSGTWRSQLLKCSTY